MAKIGRNEPCPCGSGKKYKTCCLNKEKITITPAPRTNQRWKLEDIEELSTKEIINKLHKFGVPFKEADFIEQANQFHSAAKLGSTWIENNPISAKRFDVDFIWMAAIILWERLIPDKINSEQIDDLMEDGYSDLENQNEMETCNKWLQVWDYLKENFTTDMKSVDDAEKTFEGMQTITDWCQDFEQELGNAAIEDKQLHQVRIKYCDEFCHYFPNSDELIMVNMQRAKADSLFEIGEAEKGEQVYQKLIENYPNNIWGYIGWGDIYAFGVQDVSINKDRAKQIYEMALNKKMKDEEVVSERLDALEQ